MTNFQGKLPSVSLSFQKQRNEDYHIPVIGWDTPGRASLSFADQQGAGLAMGQIPGRMNMPGSLSKKTIMEGYKAH